MKSIIVKNPINEANLIKKTLERGGLIVFPTETVYGIGASIYDEKAIENIFLTKGRPQDNPLIVHIADLTQLDDLVIAIPAYAKKLMNAFWPGPLTIVFYKSKRVNHLLTAGLPTVAVRMPKDPIAQGVLIAASVPIAAPSANLSGKPSGTDFKSVYEDFFGKVSLFVEGGIPEYGIESTVIDVTSTIPTILRPGAISVEAIEKVLGTVVLSSSAVENAPKSPGMKYQHYKPFGDDIILDGDDDKIVEYMKQVANDDVVFMGANEVCGALSD
jgi:L-threonylcarbamoyladenylate synthase